MFVHENILEGVSQEKNKTDAFHARSRITQKCTVLIAREVMIAMMKL